MVIPEFDLPDPPEKRFLRNKEVTDSVCKGVTFYAVSCGMLSFDAFHKYSWKVFRKWNPYIEKVSARWRSFGRLNKDQKKSFQ
jgi:hypothetical protein